MDCIFCKIIAGEISGEIEFENDDLIILQDINPKAQTHVLLIPKEHIVQPPPKLTDAKARLLGSFFAVARDFAQERGLLKAGYVLRNNNGREAGQEAEHFHLHLMSEKAL